MSNSNLQSSTVIDVHRYLEHSVWIPAYVILIGVVVVFLLVFPILASTEQVALLAIVEEEEVALLAIVAEVVVLMCLFFTNR
jgi:hypothetical protein